MSQECTVSLTDKGFTVIHLSVYFPKWMKSYTHRKCSCTVHLQKFPILSQNLSYYEKIFRKLLTKFMNKFEDIPNIPIWKLYYNKTIFGVLMLNIIYRCIRMAFKLFYNASTKNSKKINYRWAVNLAIWYASTTWASVECAFFTPWILVQVIPSEMR